MEISERVRKVLASVCAVDVNTITDDALLRNYLDSAAALEFLLDLEEEFKVVLPDDATTKATTLSEVVLLLDQLLRRSA